MEISDVRVRLVTDTNDRLKAVCSVTLGDQFVIRDIKLVDGTGGLFVAMPSRKLSAPCPNCRTQNHLRARYCNECGKQVPAARIPKDDNGREKAHRDVAHPITPAFRQAIQDRVLDAYEEEMQQNPVQEHCDEKSPTECADASPKTERVPELESKAYNSMIADLDGGRPRGRSKESGQHSSGEKSDQSGRGGRGRRRDRQRDVRDSGAARKEPIKEVSAAKPSVDPKPQERPERKPTIVEPVCTPRATSGGATDHDQSDSPFGCGIDDAPPPTPKRDVAPAKKESVARVEPTPQRDETDNDSGFGAGIL